jgi:nucleoside-diphosphate-sugar epimerase
VSENRINQQIGTLELGVVVKTTKLVLGASGFLGSHVTRQLVQRGEDVRVMLRRTSSTRALDDLGVERHYGDVLDVGAIRSAMQGCDDVYYCIVDARAWLRDPASLFATNVQGLQNVLELAVQARLRRFVFTSTVGTLGVRSDRPVTEDDPRNWNTGNPYIESRVAAESLVMEYARERDLPAVALCVSTTYGPGDWQPTPHGGMLARVAAGRFPFHMDFSSEVVGIEDAAQAMLLAAENGRAGERYIVSDRYMSMRDVHNIAADEAGVKRPRLVLSRSVLSAAAHVNDAAASVLRRDLLPLSVKSIRTAQMMGRLDHSKAERELGWRPRPVELSIRRAAQFYVAQAKSVLS